jgi:hypothetical protein
MVWGMVATEPSRVRVIVRVIRARQSAARTLPHIKLYRDGRPIAHSRTGMFSRASVSGNSPQPDRATAPGAKPFFDILYDHIGALFGETACDGLNNPWEDSGKIRKSRGSTPSAQAGPGSGFRSRATKKALQVHGLAARIGKPTQKGSSRLARPLERTPRRTCP